MKYKLLLTIIVVFVMVISMMAVSLDSTSGQINSDSAGVNSSTSINTTMGNYFHSMHNYGSKITYNSTTGLVSGKYFNTTFKNGVFSGFNDSMTSTELISSMYANSSGIHFILLPLRNLLFNGTLTMGDLFLYMNSTSFYAIHNNPSLETNIMLHDGELHINLPSGAKIEYNTTNNIQVSSSASASFNSSINSSNSFETTSMSSKFMLDFNNTVYASRSMIVVDNNGTIYMLLIHNGNFSIKNNTITVSTKGIAMVSLVVPQGFQHFSASKAILSSMMNGKLSGEIDLETVNGTLQNSTTYFNSSLNLKFTGNTSSTETFNVNSNNSHSTIVAIFISNDVPGYNGHEYVKFDGKIISKVSMSALVNETSTTNAYYAYDNTSSGSEIMVYVPHFSDHTIEVSSKPFENYTEYIVAGGIVAVIAIGIIAGVMIQRKKNSK